MGKRKREALPLPEYKTHKNKKAGTTNMNSMRTFLRQANLKIKRSILSFSFNILADFRGKSLCTALPSCTTSHGRTLPCLCHDLLPLLPCLLTPSSPVTPPPFSFPACNVDTSSRVENVPIYAILAPLLHPPLPPSQQHIICNPLTSSIRYMSSMAMPSTMPFAGGQQVEVFIYVTAFNEELLTKKDNPQKGVPTSSALVLIMCERRDMKTKRGKTFKGLYENAKPKKKE
ncbi:hypothetical protein Cgig2_007588 [Carnegiea gigantea]|uniref:Uncharacterized protein n=1 Tax=Carnegiea gigantea TaxID=171969 RepID=A0A9Q1K072_9CARY|nr:hypothetical protein Cgig2_007588 [Carnegiea gigantea]